MKYGHSIIIASLLALTACSGNTVKTTLGLDRGAPDEFRVVSRPPLSVPPQFSLRPPGSAADSSLGQLPTSGQAKALMIGGTPAADVTVGKATTPTATSKSRTTAESEFLKNVGAGQADPMVRDKITEDRIIVQQQPEETSWWNIFSSSSAKKDPLVNANQESQRIKTNEDAGQPVTQGDTPVVKDRDTGLLGKIFGY